MGKPLTERHLAFMREFARLWLAGHSLPDTCRELVRQGYSRTAGGVRQLRKRIVRDHPEWRFSFYAPRLASQLPEEFAPRLTHQPTVKILPVEPEPPEPAPGGRDLLVARLRKAEVLSMRAVRDILGGITEEQAREACEALAAEGHPIEVHGPAVVWAPGRQGAAPAEPLWAGRERIVFAAIADTHFGSRAQQPTALRAFLEEAAERYGVTHVLHSGDMIAGVGGFRGWAQTVMATSVDEQVRIAAAALPADLGLTYWILGGNHDAWTMRDGGANPIATLAAHRDDVHFIGWDKADIPLTERILVRLWHPAGGQPYALSYRGQRYLQALSSQELHRRVWGDEQPDQRIRIVLAGHLHVSAYFLQGPIHYLQVPCWEGQTDYMERKGLIPTVGGWIVEIECEGEELRAFMPRHYEYRPRERDWGPRPALVDHDVPSRPLFLTE